MTYIRWPVYGSQTHGAARWTKWHKLDAISRDRTWCGKRICDGEQTEQEPASNRCVMCERTKPRKPPPEPQPAR